MPKQERPGSSCSQRSIRSTGSTGYTLKTWKIIVLGDPRVGKTSLICKYATGKLPDSKDNDLPPEFMEKKVTLPDREEQVYVSIWNLPFRTNHPNDVSKSFFVGAHGCLFVFSTVDQTSFTDLAMWVTAVTDFCGDIPVAFAENKIDLIDETVLNHKDVETMAKSYKLRLYRTSAKADHNVSEVFNYLVSKIVQKYPDPLHVSRQSSADSMRVRAGSSPGGSVANSARKNYGKSASSLSIEVNGEGVVSHDPSAAAEPAKRRTGGVKPVVNRHAITNKKCEIM